MGLFAIRGETRTDSIVVVTQLIEIKNKNHLNKNHLFIVNN